MALQFLSANKEKRIPMKPMQSEEDETLLLKTIARSEGYTSATLASYETSGTGGTRKQGYLPLYHHPLPVSPNRFFHEKNLSKVMSCRVEYQGIAAITKGDAWALEEVYMRSDLAVMGRKNGATPLHVAIQMNDIE